jgi:osmotically-inducible protein OsmY
MPNDQTITASIRTALDADTRIRHPREIAVSCKDGWVALRGNVPTFRERSVAQELAGSVPGVKGVSAELHLDLLDNWADGEIRGTALQALMADTAVPAERVEVAVSDGWLTLRGEVKDQSSSDAAFAAVAGLPGVGGITNEIKVITAGLDG